MVASFESLVSGFSPYPAAYSLDQIGPTWVAVGALDPDTNKWTHTFRGLGPVLAEQREMGLYLTSQKRAGNGIMLLLACRATGKPRS